MSSTPADPGTPVSREGSKQISQVPEEPTRFVDWLDWLPWEKILIWGLFLVVVYTLRHFFFIIFMTFILSYIMRSSVLRVARVFSPRKERIWLERGLTLVGFVLLLFGFYEAVNYFGPRLVTQAKQLVERGTRLDPRQEIDTFMTKTIGAYAFQRKYGGHDDPRYQQAFEEFLKRDSGVDAYEKFPSLEASLEARFLDQEKRRIEQEIQAGVSGTKEFEAWFLRDKAPGIFSAKHEFYVEQYEKAYENAYRLRMVTQPLEEFKKSSDYEKTRDEIILGNILEDELKDEKKRTDLRMEWEGRLVTTALAAFKSSPTYADGFRRFYEGQAAVSGGPPYPYEKFLALREARAQGREAFLGAFRDAAPEPDDVRIARARTAFEYENQRDEAQRILQSTVAQWILANLAPYGEAGMKSLTGWIRDAIAFLLTIPIQLALCLLLSFFITIDMPRIRAGILRLKQSRLSDFYEEIAPGLYNFGRLIGRAFQAQGLIAFFNTVLTFFAIKYIGIENEIFLSSIVFVCSFIPVLGVVLSSVPISVMAIVQPDGTVLMAVYIILAILVIHFIETSILNPKILGDMLHLHPVLVLAVLAIGEHFAGVWGLLLGVPVAVYIIRCVILNEEIPGLIEQSPLPEDRLAAASAGAASIESFQIDVATFAPDKGHDAGAVGTPRDSSPGAEGDEDAAPEASIVTGARDAHK